MKVTSRRHEAQRKQSSPRARRPMKRSEAAALQIVEDIVHDGMSAGAKLPLEAELLAHHGISRSSLREALRLLEVQGIIKIKPGPRGGTEVGEANPARLAETLNLHLVMARASLGELLDAWLLVEPLLSKLAAASKDRERVDRLMRPYSSQAAPHERAPAEGLAFHDTVADLADNKLLSLVFGAIGHLVTERVRWAAPDFELSDATLHSHTEIADLILKGHEHSAHDAMKSHIEEVIAEMSIIFSADQRERPIR